MHRYPRSNSLKFWHSRVPFQTPEPTGNGGSVQAPIPDPGLQDNHICISQKSNHLAAPNPQPLPSSAYSEVVNDGLEPFGIGGVDSYYSKAPAASHRKNAIPMHKNAQTEHNLSDTTNHGVPPWGGLASFVKNACAHLIS